MDDLKTALQKMHEAYRVGSKKPALHLSDKDFQHYQSVVYSHLSANDQSLLSRCAASRNQGLSAARREKLGIADYFFKEEDTLLHRESFSPEGFLIGKSAHEAAVAYLDYRRNDFKKAIMHISEALITDESLEEQYGHTIYHLHRIQLILNLIRVHKRRTCIKEAITIGFHLLSYLERKSTMLPVPTSWDSTRLVSQPLEIITIMFIQVASEIACMLEGRETITVGSEVLSIRDLFMGARDHTSPDTSNDCYLSPRTHLWLNAKRDFVNNDIIKFLKSTVQFLADGRGDMRVLWYAILVDCVILCNNLDLLEANLIKQDIMKDALSWEWTLLPPSWKPVLDIKITSERKV